MRQSSPASGSTGSTEAGPSSSDLLILPRITQPSPRNLIQELRIGKACAVHFQSVANQSQFVLLRDRFLAEETEPSEKEEIVAQLEDVLQREVNAAKILYMLQSQDSRLGFEASNQYFYIPMDLAEKVVLCRSLLDEWLPKGPK